MWLENNQLKDIAKLVDLDLASLNLIQIIFDEDAKQYRLKTSFDKDKDLITKHELVIEFNQQKEDQIVKLIKLIKPELSESSFNFYYSLEPFYSNVYLLISLDNFQSSEIDKYDFIKENIKLKIDNYFLNQELAIQELKYLAYLKEVKTIKEKLLPSKDHAIDGLDYAVYYQPSLGGGGDYYDVADLRSALRRAGDEDPPLIWGVGLMDVSGHGPGAAVEVAMVDAILRTYEGQIGSEPSDVISYINKYFFTRQFRGSFSTCLLSNYDTSTQTYSYSSAGHLPILVKHGDGTVSVIESKTGIPVGVEKEHEWVTETIQLEPGDSIILFTDGITEAESKQGKQFGLDNLVACFEKSNAKNVENLMADFEFAFNQYTKGVDRNDDQTLIIINITCCHINEVTA